MHISFLVVLSILLLPCLAVAGDNSAAGPKHGLVGLRPLPRTKELDHSHNHGGSWAGTPTYAEQKDKYPFVAENIDTIKGWLDGDFKTKRMFFEYYWGIEPKRDVLDPTKNHLVKVIKNWESKGATVDHILICREYRLAVQRGHKNAKPGPFKEDTRILYEKDYDDIRAMFKQAHKQGILKHDNYALIQMVEHPTFFATDKRFLPIMKKVDGICYEAHQFNRHWPLKSGWSKPEKVIKGAKWTLEQGKEYVFYFGPIIYKPKEYPAIERKWLETFWKKGLPKHHPKMHYYLNTFPHMSARKRPVGPETNPESTLGFTKWLIEEIKGKAPKPKSKKSEGVK